MPTQRKYGRAAVKDRARFLAYNPLCIKCQAKGWTRAATEVDHVTPLHKDGADEDDNKQALCSPCHKAKTADDKGYIQRGADLAGMPLSLRHHWLNKQRW